MTPQKLIFCTLASQEIIGTFSLKYLCLRINFLLKGELGPSCEEIELSYSVPNKKGGSVTLDTNVTFCFPPFSSFCVTFSRQLIEIMDDVFQGQKLSD